MKPIALIGLLAALAVSACATQGNVAKLTNPGAQQTLPSEFLLLPLDVRVSELGVGGSVEEVPSWTQSAKGNVSQALTQVLPQFGLHPHTLPVLSREEQAQLDEHIALLDAVGLSAFVAAQRNSDLWKAKARRFDYGLGDGLAWLAAKTGQRSALLLIGEDYVSSTGRVVAGAFAALLGVVATSPPAITGAMVIDLNDGRLRWVNVRIDQSGRTLKSAEDSNALVRAVLEPYSQLRTAAARKDNAT